MQMKTRLLITGEAQLGGGGAAGGRGGGKEKQGMNENRRLCYTDVYTVNPNLPWSQRGSLPLKHFKDPASGVFL